jgi:hypothetical protein
MFEISNYSGRLEDWRVGESGIQSSNLPTLQLCYRIWLSDFMRVLNR